IPNAEIEYIYNEIILNWFQPNQQMANAQYEKMLRFLIQGDIPAFEHYFQETVQVVFSYFDTSDTYPEVAYHSFSLGMLVSLRDAYEVVSNREGGYGRHDLMLIP